MGMKNKEWLGLTKIEEYFEIYGIYNDDEKIRYASMQLEGDV
jgi:hypothetical protein